MNAPIRPPIAIQTEYGGARFRSRTEARWAVFFDALGIAWEYERDGFELTGGRYLPDFWLPGLDLFIEIKGQAPTLEERRKCTELAEETGKRVALFPHAPRAFDWGRYFEQNDAPSTMFFPGVGGGDDDGYWFCVCPVCRKIGLEFEGRGDRVCKNKCCASDHKMITGDAQDIVEAARRANGFRFWEAK